MKTMAIACGMVEFVGSVLGPDLYQADQLGSIRRSNEANTRRMAWLVMFQEIPQKPHSEIQFTKVSCAVMLYESLVAHDGEAPRKWLPSCCH